MEAKINDRDKAIEERDKAIEELRATVGKLQTELKRHVRLIFRSQIMAGGSTRTASNHEFL
jgi:hypothetical protein